MSRPHFRVYASAFALMATSLLPAFGRATAQAETSAAIFAPQSVGTVSAAQTVTLTVRSAGTALAPVTTPEFQVVPGGSCAAQQTYAAGDICTVLVTFAPQAAGTVAGAIGLPGNGGLSLGIARLRGTALGSAAAFTPGLVDTLALSTQATHSFSAITSAANGVAYLADSATGQVLQYNPLTGATAAIAPALPASDPVTAIAADVSGPLFLLRASGALSRVDIASGAPTPVDYSAAPVGSSHLPTAMAVDAEGRLLLAFGASVARLQDGTWTALAGSATPCADATSACGDGGAGASAQFGNIRSIAVDASDSILLSDTAAYRIRRIEAATGLVSTVSGIGTACTHGPCGNNGPASSAALNTVSGLTVDSLGNIFLAEQGSGLRRIDAHTGVISAVLPSSETRFTSGSVAPAALRDGSVLLLTGAAPATVSHFTAGASSLTFAQTAVGQTSTDSVQSVSLTNLGNAPLTLATPAIGSNPSTSADFPLSSTQTCPQVTSSSNSQSLAPGDSCSIQVKFTPTSAGHVSSQVVVTESAPSAQTAHTISVQGIAAAPPTTQAGVALVSLPDSPVYGQPVSLVVTVYDSSHSGVTPTGTVTFTEGSSTLASNVALSGGNANYTITLPSTASHTYAVSYSGDTTYAPSAQNTTLNVTVARAASVFTVNLPTYQYGETIRSAYVLSGQYSGTGIDLPSGVVTYTLLDSNGNVVVTGISNHANRVNSIDENAPLGMLHGGTYTLRLSYPGDVNFLPLQQDYTLVVQPLAQTIVFSPIASPVTYGTPPIPLSATAYAGNPSAPDGLPVTFSVLSGPGTIVNGQLVVTGVGTIVVAANQAGNSDYAAAPQVTQTVVSVRPVARLTWNTPAPILTGTPLSSTQLNASATDPNGQPLAGIYTYTPPAGTVLPVGNTTLNVTFVPADTDHYGNVTLTASVVLTVRDLTTPAISFVGGSVAFGSGTGPVLNATATANGAAVPGTFVYTSGGATLTPASSLPVGTYTVLATFTPADGNTYRGGTATATITVTRGAPAMSLVSSASPVLLNSNVTLTAHLAGGSAAPTGTVQFTSGTTNLGSATVDSSGNASLLLNTLPAGSQTITAVYSGDANYGTASATLTEVVADFTLAVAANSSAKQSVLPGKVATYQFTVSPTVTAALVSDVSFTVSGLPSGATYTLTPTTVAGGSAATTVTLAITTPAVKAQMERAPGQRTSAVIAAALLLLPFSSRLRRGILRVRGAGLLATVLLASAVLLATTGCGAGIGYFDGAQSTSTITLDANSGSLSHTASVTLEIQ